MKRSLAARTRLGIDNLNNSGSRSSVINFTYNNGNTSAWELGNDIEANGTQSFYLYDNIAAAARLYFNASGNVGIGTTNPGAKLDVEGGIIRIGDGAGGYSGFSFNQTNGLVQENNNKVTLQGALQINSTAGQNSYIAGTGNVLIGKTTQANTNYKLDYWR